MHRVATNNTCGMSLQIYLGRQSTIRRIIDNFRFFIIKPFFSNIQFFKNIFNIPLSPCC